MPADYAAPLLQRLPSARCVACDAPGVRCDGGNATPAVARGFWLDGRATTYQLAEPHFNYYWTICIAYY